MWHVQTAARHSKETARSQGGRQEPRRSGVKEVNRGAGGDKLDTAGQTEVFIGPRVSTGVTDSAGTWRLYISDYRGD